jgi:hypothetical protein
MMRLTVGIRIYPHTPLARAARRLGMIPDEAPLLQPPFYLREELTPWLPETIRALAAEHSNWIT